MIENPRTGETLEFVHSAPELLVMETTWTRPGHRAPAHVHPAMEERFEVIQGRAEFVVDGRNRDAGVGEVVIVPPGIRHLARNPTSGPVRLQIEMRPALRWREFTERLFAGEEPALLLLEYAAELTL